MDQIFHIAESEAWRCARLDGFYRQSTLGKSLDDVGFIHCSFHHQVADVANRTYPGRRDLVLLIIDVSKVSAEIRTEGPGGTNQFPHIYGPLNIDAVTETVPYLPAAGGQFRSPR